MLVRLGCDTKRVAVAPPDSRRQPIMEAQSNICGIRTHSLFIHANTTILKKLNRVSSPSLTGGIRQNIYQGRGSVSRWPRLSSLADTPRWITRPWFVFTGSPLSFLYACFANNAWFGTRLVEMRLPPRCARRRKHARKRMHVCVYHRWQAPRTSVFIRKTLMQIYVMDICDCECMNRSGCHFSTVLHH